MTNELLTVDQMYSADARTIEAGTPGLVLMENAGRACADAICERWKVRSVAVLCGPGNNGGDGFVIARLLQERGWDVRLSLLGDKSKLKGDAAEVAGFWTGEVHPLTEKSADGCGLVVDAVFGAGLSKPVGGTVAQLFKQIADASTPVMAVDVPSGVHGTTGALLGIAPTAHLTVTFHRKKLGHVLMPGRVNCGEIVVADIGISPDHSALEEMAAENVPDHWLYAFPSYGLADHKYGRGHGLVVSGPMSFTGAARLAARGALRVGAGLVTVASPPGALMVNAAHLTSIMVRSFDGADGLADMLSDRRKNAIAIGPGCGVGEGTRSLVTTVLKSGRAAVLDADALTSFEDRPQDLYEACHKHVVMTPHAGEFARIFPKVHQQAEDKVSATRAAAAATGAVIVYKGPDTVIADARGRATVNTNAPPWLATAGSGDVLAGFVSGLMAQHMDPYPAACAAVWLHGECANYLGRGLIAEDLPEVLPDVLQSMDDL